MKFILTILLVLLLSGCSVLPIKHKSHTAWEGLMPSQSYFEDYYNKDVGYPRITSLDDYLSWVKRFYLGSIYYSRGWLQSTDELLESLENPEEKVKAKEAMYSIGRDSSAEWALSYKYRLVNLSNMSVWGNTLRKSIKLNQQMQIIEKVRKDLDLLLARKIKSSDISEARYYPEESSGSNGGKGQNKGMDPEEAALFL